MDVAVGKSITSVRSPSSIAAILYLSGQADAPNMMMFIAIFTNEVTDAISVSIDAEYDVLAYSGAIFSEIGITANFGN